MSRSTLEVTILNSQSPKTTHGYVILDQDAYTLTNQRASINMKASTTLTFLVAFGMSTAATTTVNYFLGLLGTC